MRIALNRREKDEGEGLPAVMCRGFTHGWRRCALVLGGCRCGRSSLLWRIHACVIPGGGGSSARRAKPGGSSSPGARVPRPLVLAVNICEGIMLDCAALPPRRYLLVAGPQVVVCTLNRRLEAGFQETSRGVTVPTGFDFCGVRAIYHGARLPSPFCLSSRGQPFSSSSILAITFAPRRACFQHVIIAYEADLYIL